MAKRSTGKAEFIGVAELKARCTGVIKGVNRSLRTYVVTVRGAPVAEIRPLPSRAPKVVQFGGMRGTAELKGNVVSAAGSEWYGADTETVFNKP
jgi:antitoxin (DNA-binding transcriptional repressor) of toxin-antitoxin stability system